MSPSLPNESSSEAVGPRFRSARDRGSMHESWLRRLNIAGVALPVAFIVCLQLVREPLVDRWWPQAGDMLLSLLTALAAVGFGVVMFAIIGRGHRQVVRRNRELASVNDLLLLIAADSAGGRVRTAAIDEARSLLQAQGSGVSPEHAVPQAGRVWAHVLRSRLRGPMAEALWVGRDAVAGVFDRADQDCLDRLADLCALGQERDRLRDTERNAAIVTERLRISREMHDSLAQVLAVTHLRLRALAARSDVNEPVAEELTDVAGTCHEAYGDVRETIHGLRQTARDDRDCVETMRGYVEWFTRQSGIDARFDVAPCSPTLCDHAAMHTLRVMQEALTNVRKHSGATLVEVSLAEASAEDAPHATINGAAVARLVVADDGHGFDPGAVSPSDHYGLRSMRERAEAIGGRLVLESRNGHGTRVIMYVPCPQTDRRAGETTRMPGENGCAVGGAEGPMPGTEQAGRVRA